MSKRLFTVLLSEFTLLILLALISGYFLTLPSMHSGGTVSFIDAVFTTTSALTVTGLSVLPTGSTFTLDGKILLLILIEIGGIGIVVLGSLFELALLKKTPKGLNYEQNSRDLSDGWHKVPNILLFSIKFILISQFIGFLMLWMWGKLSPFDALFHSISAFNNAGFSTFDSSLMSFSSSASVLIPIALLIFFGSVGFLTVTGLYRRLTGVDHALSVYTKLLLKISGVLYLVTTLLLFIDLMMHRVPVITALWEASFQSVSLRTAGFNTVIISDFGTLGILTAIIMMVIGGGSISTAGGIKMSTFYVFIKNILAHLKGETKIVAIKRSYYIPKILVETSYFIIITYFLTFLVSIFLLTFTESRSGIDLTSLSFESISALSTVGLSMGITSSLTVWSKGILIFDMMLGRLGVYLVMRKIFLNVVKLRKSRKRNRLYPNEDRDLKELEIAIG